MNLTKLIFEIQQQILDLLPPVDDMEWWDTGMMVNPNRTGINTLWRDLAYQMEGEEEVCFSYSTNGDYKGVLPKAHKIQILSILDEYKSNKPLVEVNNL